VTQSPYVRDQIEQFYGIDADIIGAPVDCDLFRPSEEPPEDFYLLCGRLIEPYKRMGLVVRAFRDFPRQRLVVAGDGPAMPELRAMAGPNVEFLGHLNDTDVASIMQRCKAAIFPSQDDFGLIPVEVMACGRPVLAYGAGGALYTVVRGVTGAFFGAQTDEAVRTALAAFDPYAYDPAEIRRHAMRWDSGRFRERIRAIVTQVVEADRAAA
jgi:glycosyltransferase involved in cell wall biosynthesis